MSVVVVSLALEDAAQSVGLSEKYLRAAVKSGDLIAHRAGRKFLFFPNDLREWVEAMPVAEKES